MEYGLIIIAELFLLYLLKRAVLARLYLFARRALGGGRMALRAYSLLLFPGVLLHELSHIVAAELLGVKIGAVEFVPTVENSSLKLGSVEIERTRGLRRFIIGVAPFLIGLPLLLVSVYVIYDSSMDIIEAAVLVFIAFEIGNTMFSSKSDLEGVWIILVLGAVLLGVFWYIGILPADGEWLNRLTRPVCLLLVVPLIINSAAAMILSLLVRKRY